MRRFVLAFLALILASLPLVGSPERRAEALVEDWDLPGGHFYTQTARAGQGFAVLDEGGIPFWTAVQTIGGMPVTGYPISQRFQWNGFTVQAFQKVILQWQPATGQVNFLNVFDLFHERNLDPWLRTVRSVPEPFAVNEAGKPWEQIVRDRQAWLNANPAIRAQYFAVPYPVEQYGLPTSQVVDFGIVQVVRLQRAVIQQWKVDVPWAAAGQVTVANGGDVAKEAGLLPADVLAPMPAPPFTLSQARPLVRADPSLSAALDRLDITSVGRPLIAALALAQTELAVAALPPRVRAGYIPSRGLILVNRELLSASPQALSAVVGHEAAHVRDDLAGLLDGSPSQCYQSELRAFKVTAEIWQEHYPGGKPDPADDLERELNALIRWTSMGTDFDRLNTLSQRYDEQCERWLGQS